MRSTILDTFMDGRKCPTYWWSTMPTRSMVATRNAITFRHRRQLHRRWQHTDRFLCTRRHRQQLPCLTVALAVGTYPRRLSRRQPRHHKSRSIQPQLRFRRSSSYRQSICHLSLPSNRPMRQPKFLSLWPRTRLSNWTTSSKRPQPLALNCHSPWHRGMRPTRYQTPTMSRTSRARWRQ